MTTRAPLTLQDVRDDLVKRAFEMRHFAARHPVRVIDGESVSFPELRYSAKLPNWESVIVLVFAVEVVEDKRPGKSGPRTVRHLSIQQSWPANVTQGNVNLINEEVANSWAWLTALFFPNDTEIAFFVKATTPIAVGDPTTKRLSFRTPIVVHYVAEGLEDLAPRAEA